MSLHVVLSPVRGIPSARSPGEGELAVSLLSVVVERQRELQHGPTEAEPEYGEVVGGGFVLSAARRWVDEDGTHVVESLEFDIVGMAADFPSALQNFVDRADDLFDHYADLAEQDELTDYEREAGKVLGPRLIEFYKAWNAQLQSVVEELEQKKPSLMEALFSSRRRAIRQQPEIWLSQMHKDSSPPLSV